MTDVMKDEFGAPKIVDRKTFQAELDALRVREKAHTREGDAIAAARRRLPMVEVEAPQRSLANVAQRRQELPGSPREDSACTDWRDARCRAELRGEARPRRRLRGSAARGTVK
jgi:hypothetical protein